MISTLNDLTGASPTILSLFDSIQLESSLYIHVPTNELTAQIVQACNYTINSLFTGPNAPVDGTVALSVKLKSLSDNRIFLLLLTPTGANSQLITLYQQPTGPLPTPQLPPPPSVPFPTRIPPTTTSKKYAAVTEDTYSIVGIRSTLNTVFKVGKDNSQRLYEVSIRNRCLNNNIKLNITSPLFIQTDVQVPVMISPRQTRTVSFVFSRDDLVYNTNVFDGLINFEITPIYDGPIEIE